MGVVTDYPYIYPVILDTAKPRPTSPIAIPHDSYQLKIASDPAALILQHDVFVDENNNIFLGLERLPSRGHQFNLKLNGLTYRINKADWSLFSHLYDRPVQSSHGLFVFSASRALILSDTGRCDEGIRGPSEFISEEEGRPVNPTFHPVMEDDITMVTKLEVVLSVDGAGHIVYAEGRPGTEDREDYVINRMPIPRMTRTIREMLRLLVEWQIASQPPLNSTDEIASCADRFLSALKIPDNVMKDITSQTEMQVSRYLRGNNNARTRPPEEEILPITNRIKNWLATKAFHPSIDALYDSVLGI